MTTLKPYPVYRDVGVEWLADVPEHWSVRRMKTLARLKAGEGITSDSIEEAGPFPVYGGNGIRGFSDAFTHSGAFALIGRQGALCGNVHFVDGTFWASEHAIVASPTTNLEMRWLARVLRVMNLGQYSISAAQPGIGVESIRDLVLPYPPLDEQRAIADFLDAMDARITRFIAARKKMIRLLEEKKQAVINQAVTKGLDPTVPMRDSGVDWLGEIPAHWDVAALRYRYSVQLGKMLDAKRITGDHLVPYLRNIDVRWDSINTDSLPSMDIFPSEYTRYIVREGDLLVCEGGEVGRSAIWRGSELIGFQKALHRVRPLDARKDSAEFFYYVMLATANLGVFAGRGNENTFNHLTGEAFRAYRFGFPPLQEQMEIARFLTAESEQVDKAKQHADREIELMQEYRTRLISDVVTGKLDVRGVDLGELPGFETGGRPLRGPAPTDGVGNATGGRIIDDEA